MSGTITVKDGNQTTPTKPVKKKRIWWRVLLAWFGGFVAFPIVVAGSAFAVASAVKVKDIVSLTGQDPNEYIGIDYQDDTILSLIFHLQGKEFKTLEDFNSVSPMVGKVINEQINPKLYEAVGFEFNWEEMKLVPIMPEGEEKGLGQYVTDSLLNGITIAHFVDTSTIREGYLLFLFETDSEGTINRDAEGNITNRAFTLNDFMGENGSNTLNGVTDKLRVSSLLSDEQIANATGIVKTMLDWKIGEIEDKVNTLTIADFFEPEEVASNSLINTLKDFTINDFTNETKVNGLKLAGFLESDKEGASLLAQELGEFTIGQVKEGNIVNDLTLAAIFPVEAERSSVVSAIMENKRKEAYNEAATNGFMGSYEDWLDADPANQKYTATVRDLSDEDVLMSLTISDFTTVTDENSIMWSFKDTTLEELKGKDVETLLLADILSKDKYVYNPSNPDEYNKVLAAIMENERKDVYEAYKAGPDYMGETYEEWLDADPENQKYTATVGDLTDYSSIDRLELSDVMNNTSGNQVIAALFAMHSTVGSISADINTLKLGQVIDPSTLAEGSVARNFIEALDADDSANIGNIGSKIGGITMGEVFGVPTTATTYDDLTPEQKADIPYVLFSLRESTLDELKTDLNNLTIGQATDVTGTIFDKEEIRNTSLSDAGDLADVLKANLKLGDLIDNYDECPTVLQKLIDIQEGDSSKNLNTLKDDIKVLTLNDIMDIYTADVYTPGHEGDPMYLEHAKSSQILISLADLHLFGDGTDNLEYRLNNLTIKDAFTEADCNNNNVLKALWNNATYPNGTMPIGDIAERINDVTIVEMLGDDLYENPTSTDPAYNRTIDDVNYKKIKATWWFLLTAEGETFTSQEKFFKLKNGLNYKINSMSTLVTNMKYHMTQESLLELEEAEFISITDSTKLYKVCPIYDADHDGVFDPEDGDRRYIDLSVSEFLDAVITFIP